MCAVVPDGVVLFLPSYAYEDELYKFWDTQGYIEKLEKRKKVLREPRSTADTDKVGLCRYGGCGWGCGWGLVRVYGRCCGEDR